MAALALIAAGVAVVLAALWWRTDRRLQEQLRTLVRERDEAIAERDTAMLAGERMRRAVDSLGLGVLVFDGRGSVVYRNDAASLYTSGRRTEAMATATHRRADSRRARGCFGPAHDRAVRTAAALDRPLGVAARRRRSVDRRGRAHRRRVRTSAAGSRPPRLRGQHQPRAQDAGGRAQPARRDAARRGRCRCRGPAGRAHPRRSAAGRPHDRRPARTVAHRDRRDVRARSRPRRRRRRRGGATHPSGCRAARHRARGARRQPRRRRPSAIAASSCRRCSTCSTTR